MSLLLLLVYALVFVGTVFFAVPTPLLPHHTHMAHLSESGAGMSTCKTFDQMAGDLKA